MAETPIETVGGGKDEVPRLGWERRVSLEPPRIGVSRREEEGEDGEEEKLT